MNRRVVVTGLGVVTPIGTGREPVWQGLLAGECGFSEVAAFDTADYPVHIGAEVREFAPELYVRNLDLRRVGRASQLAIAAARLALDDGDLDSAALDPRCGVSMGTTSGEPNEVERFIDHLLADSLDEMGSEMVERYPCHVIAALVASELGLEGPNIMIPTACAAGNYAVAHAFEVIKSGATDLMLAGGADAFSRITYTGFARLRAVAPERCQPFDRDRKGMIPGEGSGVLLLEELESARRRRARIYAEVVGYGLSCDAHHMTAAHPEGAGARRAMRQAMEQAGIGVSELSYISAHGTGTSTNDRLETIAVRAVLGDHAPNVPMSSIKSMLGHTMGAASAIESAVCCLAVERGCIPPTANFEHRDPECDLDYVTEGARELDVEVAMNNAYAFGGNNASVLFRACGGAAA